MDDKSFGIKLYYPFPDKIDIQFIEDSQPINPNVYCTSEPLVFRTSEELEYTEEDAASVIAHHIEKMALLILCWLKHNNIQGDINLIWRLEQVRHSLKVGCGAYAG